MSRAILLVAVLAAMALGLRMADGARRSAVEPMPRPTLRPAPAQPPRLPAAAIDRQDRVPLEQQRLERRAGRERRLLALLPIELAGVRIDVTGLTEDDRALVTVVIGPRGEAYVRALLRRTLNALGDTRNAYRMWWVR